MDDAYFGELETGRWGLTPVAQLDSYKGMYFATFDPSAPPLLDYLGSMTWYLDAFFDRREGGIEVMGGVHRSIVPCNWKISGRELQRRRLPRGLDARFSHPDRVQRGGSIQVHVRWGHGFPVQRTLHSGGQPRGPLPTRRSQRYRHTRRQYARR